MQNLYYVGFPEISDNDAREITGHRNRLAEFLYNITPYDSEEIPVEEWRAILCAETTCEFGYWERALQLYTLRNPGLLIKVTCMEIDNFDLLNVENDDLLNLYVEYFRDGRYTSTVAGVYWPVLDEKFLTVTKQIESDFFVKLNGG